MVENRVAAKSAGKLVNITKISDEVGFSGRRNAISRIGSHPTGRQAPDNRYSIPQYAPSPRLTSSRTNVQMQARLNHGAKCKKSRRNTGHGRLVKNRCQRGR